MANIKMKQDAKEKHHLEKVIKKQIFNVKTELQQRQILLTIQSYSKREQETESLKPKKSPKLLNCPCRTPEFVKNGQKSVCIKCGTSIQENAQDSGQFSTNTTIGPQQTMCTDKGVALTAEQVFHRFHIKVQFNNNSDNQKENDIYRRRVVIRNSIDPLIPKTFHDLTESIIDVFVALGLTFQKKKPENLGFIIYYLRRVKGNTDSDLLLTISKEMDIWHGDIVKQGKTLKGKFADIIHADLFDSNFKIWGKDELKKKGY